MYGQALARASGGWWGRTFAHGPVLILNAAAAAQFVMICWAGEYRVLATFGFIAFIDGVYFAVVLRSSAARSRGERGV